VFRDFIFYRSDLAMVSPMVSVLWQGEVIDLFNRLPDGAGGNMPEGWCVDFVAGCCGIPEIGRGRVELWNWWPREEFDNRALIDERGELVCSPQAYESAFLTWLGEQAGAGRKKLPVFINTWLPPVAYQGGAELCRLVVTPGPPESRAVWVTAPRGQ
jgi:hypothetical protein